MFYFNFALESSIRRDEGTFKTGVLLLLSTLVIYLYQSS
jgi:hypothetical protein